MSYKSRSTSLALLVTFICAEAGNSLMAQTHKEAVQQYDNKLYNGKLYNSDSTPKVTNKRQAEPASPEVIVLDNANFTTGIINQQPAYFLLTENIVLPQSSLPLSHITHSWLDGNGFSVQGGPLFYDVNDSHIRLVLKGPTASLPALSNRIGNNNRLDISLPEVQFQAGNNVSGILTDEITGRNNTIRLSGVSGSVTGQGQAVGLVAGRFSGSDTTITIRNVNGLSIDLVPDQDTPSMASLGIARSEAPNALILRQTAVNATLSGGQVAAGTGVAGDEPADSAAIQLLSGNIILDTEKYSVSSTAEISTAQSHISSIIRSLHRPEAYASSYSCGFWDMSRCSRQRYRSVQVYLVHYHTFYSTVWMNVTSTSPILNQPSIFHAPATTNDCPASYLMDLDGYIVRNGEGERIINYGCENPQLLHTTDTADWEKALDVVCQEESNCEGLPCYYVHNEPHQLLKTGDGNLILLVRQRYPYASSGELQDTDLAGLFIADWLNADNYTVDTQSVSRRLFPPPGNTSDSLIADSPPVSSALLNNTLVNVYLKDAGDLQFGLFDLDRNNHATELNYRSRVIENGAHGLNGKPVNIKGEDEGIVRVFTFEEQSDSIYSYGLPLEDLVSDASGSATEYTPSATFDLSLITSQCSGSPTGEFLTAGSDPNHIYVARRALDNRVELHRFSLESQLPDCDWHTYLETEDLPFLTDHGHYQLQVDQDEIRLVKTSLMPSILQIPAADQVLVDGSSGTEVSLPFEGGCARIQNTDKGSMEKKPDSGAVQTQALFIMIPVTLVISAMQL